MPSTTVANGYLIKTLKPLMLDKIMTLWNIVEHNRGGEI
jgi:hypothetical protein